MKRIAALVLCLLLSVAVVPAQAIEPSSGFAQEVETAANRCINLYPCEINSYQRPITRGEFAVLSVNFVAALYGFGSAGDDFFERYFTYHTNAAGQPYKFEDYFKWPAQNSTYQPWSYLLRREYRPFTDVPGIGEVNMTIRAAQMMGLVRGQRGGSYEPNRPITRQEAAIMLGQILYLYGPQLVNRKPITYPDSAEIGEGPRPYVDIVSNADIMRGKGDGKFHPKDYFTIEQSLAVFNRMYDLLEEQLTPLYGFDVAMAEYENRPFVIFKAVFDDYAILCEFIENSYGYNPSDGPQPNDSHYCFWKFSEKGGYRGVSFSLSSPRDFRWDSRNQRLYFYVDSSEETYYLDAESMEIIPDEYPAWLKNSASES